MNPLTGEEEEGNGGMGLQRLPPDIDTVNERLQRIYISPSKALVQEKLRSWNQKLGSWGLNCLELTGDNESYSIKNIQDADIVLTTPEKFDAVTRFGIKDGGL